VCLGDALDDGQAESDPGVIRADAFAATLERFGECRGELRREFVAGVFDVAGGCFMFRSWRHTDSGNVPLTGVVLGQQGHNLINAGLYAAK
jgi:hypothetical protein